MKTLLELLLKWYIRPAGGLCEDAMLRRFFDWVDKLLFPHYDQDVDWQVDDASGPLLRR